MSGTMNDKTKMMVRAKVRAKVRIGAALAVLTAVTGCGDVLWNQEKVLFEGVEYKHKSSAVSRDDKRSFEVQVRPVSASMVGAREAGKYEGTRYCIQNYGNSDIKWQVGPDSQVLPVENDTLTLRGRCNS